MRYGDVEIPALRKAAKDQYCVRCNAHDDTIVGAHYTGIRRLNFGGGFGKKVHDLVMAHLCFNCHTWMDQLARKDASDENGWRHSEEFLFLVMLTVLRLYDQGFLVVKGERD
jgi:hypothetical protein